MNILVTGGAGYVGSHLVKRLIELGHHISVLDNLTHGYRASINPRAFFYQGSCGDSLLLARIFSEQKIDAVIHLAADSDVGESIQNPGKYYENNFASSIRLLSACSAARIKRFVFSSTATIYGSPNVNPITEAQAPNPIHPYARSKYMTELALEDFSHAYGLGYTVLRYFNVAGASPEGEIGEDHFPEHHLIPRLLAAIRDPGGAVRVFGTDYPTKDGTCIRDYVHVVDIVEAHRLAVERLEPGHGKTYNVGSDHGFSVRDVIRACEGVTERKLLVEVTGRRPGDAAVLVASGEKIRRELDWSQRYPGIEQIISHAWEWHSRNPHGFRVEETPSWDTA